MRRTEIPYKQKRRTLWFGFLLILCLLVVIVGNFYYFTRDAFRMSGLSSDRLAMGVIVEAESILKNNEEILRCCPVRNIKDEGAYWQCGRCFPVDEGVFRIYFR